MKMLYLIIVLIMKKEKIVKIKIKITKKITMEVMPQVELIVV